MKNEVYYLSLIADILDRRLENIEKALKECQHCAEKHEAVEPIKSYGTFRCGNCRNIVGYDDGCGHGYQNNFCSKCGKAVKWNA